MQTIGPFSDWDVINGLPNTLEKLLQETEINNSFVESAVVNTLKNTMESSYAYLYRMQKDSIHYKRFHFQTREYLLNTPYNNIQSGLKLYRDLLKDLKSAPEPNESEIQRVKRIIAEFGEVRFGDLFLDEKRKVCMMIDHDLIYSEVKECFRTSNFYKEDVPLSIASANKDLFRELPVVIVDGEVHADIKLRYIEQGTVIIFDRLTAKDVYTPTETQKFHDICIMCIPNVYTKTISVAKNDLTSGSFSFSEYNALHGRNGLFFISIFNKSNKSTNLIPVTVENSHVLFDSNKKINAILHESENDSFFVTVFFFQDLYRYSFEMEVDGMVPTKKKIYSSLEEYREVPESAFFIPKKNGEILPLPIPEENMIIFKSIYDNANVDRYEPFYHCGVKLYYPNMYQIDDEDHTFKDKYEIFYFYKEVPEISYTPLFDFYWNYLRNRFKNTITLEAVINKIYFKEEGYTLNWNIEETETNPDILNKRILMNETLEVFYQLFESMLAYKDYKYNYGTPDFMSEYKGDDIPLQYKIARMMEFIKADWKVLPKYVNHARHKETTFHFFTNTINLQGRFRRSTRLENKETALTLFAKSARLTTEENPNAFLVTDNKNYDRDHEIYIDDIKIMIPSITVNDYVELEDLTNRYVFAFKNPGKSFLAIKVFVDGILCSDIVTINSFGTDYLYLPTNIVHENSYIMMELEWATNTPQIETLVFNNATEWKTLHLVENDHIEYTMNDIVLKVDGVRLDESLYKKELVRNTIQYSMEDERHNITNKYGAVTDVNIQLTHITDSFPVTVEVQVNKTFFKTSGVADRNGYPRFNLTSLNLNPDISHARMYCNGRIVPTSTFKLVDSQGQCYVQSRIFYQKGDQYAFELSPYAKEKVYEVDEIDPNAVLNISDYIDKPLNPEYYEIFLNGRRLGLPNVFPFGPHHAVFRGLKSKYLLTIYEKERDFEYFGFSKIFKRNENYFYLVNDLINEPYMTESEANRIIDSYIETIKNKNAIIEPNENVEGPVTFEIENGLLEEMKIFFFEELLPLGLGDPDKLQFNKTYFSEVFPNFTNEFLVETFDENDPDVIYLNPDVTARVYNNETNDYEIIDTSDANPEKAFVMITGESD